MDLDVLELTYFLILKRRALAWCCQGRFVPIFTPNFYIHELWWITPALYNSLHFQAKCWLYGVNISLTYNFTFDSKPSFDLSIFEVSNFLLKIALQCFHKLDNTAFWNFAKFVTVLNIILSNCNIHCTGNFNNFLF